MKQSLENGAVHYKTSPVFKSGKIPAALLKEHSTKAGVWGKIVVLKGQIEYTVPQLDTTVILDSQTPGISHPQVSHFVKAIGEAEFFIEFYKMEE